MKTYFYSHESCGFSPLSDILDLVGDEKHDKNNYFTFENNELRLQLNRGDRDFGIQLLMDTLSKRSQQDCFIKLIPSIQQLACIKDKILVLANVMRFISSPSSIAKSHIYIVIVLANLNVGCDNSDPNKSLSLRQAMVSSYWKDFKKVMHVKFQSLIKNNTWKY